ncbi:MAG: FtsW/RodA/SpoVE family cell cycle protein, partial [Candidatus Omnitrophica bacterium]|nr:FtsW/RodA/SpoVE family cell cycle protein [Candidatus Omnitrophota bacterium]
AAKRAANDYHKLLALGIVTLIGLEAAVNIGVSIGALPTKGLALPFISYGGSSLLVKLMLAGLLLNVSRCRTSGTDRPVS